MPHHFKRILYVYIYIYMYTLGCNLFGLLTDKQIHHTNKVAFSVLYVRHKHTCCLHCGEQNEGATKIVKTELGELYLDEVFGSH